jgi:hypothetical protein
VLINHPDRDDPDQSTRLTAARRWLENQTTSSYANSISNTNSSPSKWLLILDNIVHESVGFLQEHLPTKNPSGNILLTTRAAIVAEAITNIAGQKHQILYLQAPDLSDAANQFLKESGILNSNSGELSTLTSRAEDLVKFVGRLPVAISHVASFARQSWNSLDDIQHICQSEDIYEVRVYAKFACS